MRRWVAATAALALAGCNGSEQPAPPEPSPTPTASPASIIRPDVEVERIEPALEPLEASVTFADAGGALSDEAISDLETIVESPQLDAGGAIVLRGHTDSLGEDEANLRISRRRAEMVRDWLVERGVDAERIRIIALGEQRPIAPNANLDGSPDEAGRAANRRVDVNIAVPTDEEPLAEGQAPLPDDAATAE
ncbi:OmpA family protein [Pelagerythrobacter marensis]|uniref:Outer membrane protein n=1 Tax=Pelagerythrobacter marensis TaxID=543877 RepID=A0A0G3XAF7_9SPHN|nr:OmpA family protein [Pelagerythrobacter marensis]AKM08182.1 Outer membrane protein [Pelagerythrobacter marensis]